MKTIWFQVRGTVQGVGFRWFTQSAARAANVNGWVRNNLDGSVEGVVQGEATAVESVLEAVSKGPRTGRVDAMEREERSLIAQTSFEIQR